MNFQHLEDLLDTTPTTLDELQDMSFFHENVVMREVLENTE